MSTMAANNSTGVSFKFSWVFKGQLISKCIFGVIVSTKIATKYCKDFCPENFEASWGLPGDLVKNIINKEAYRKPQKLPGSPKEAKKT